VCTVSSAYCRLTKDHTKIRGILHTLDPALVYASDAKVYGPAMRQRRAGALPTVFSHGADAVPGALSFDSLRAPPRARR
jgi:feruloyl-CoA synthase